MSACLLIGAALLSLAEPHFTLEWEHSVEKTAWRESWRIEPAGLRLIEAAVKGSGAGMDTGEGAKESSGWWVWQPNVAPIATLALAASGMTRGGWQLCSGGNCTEIGAAAGAALVLRPCP
jgi:hypothetical protein